MQETLQDNLANTVITKAKEIHPLFAMIVSNNIDKVMSRSAFTRAINSDNPTQELESFLKSESRVQLRLNKFFSYEQWENELKKLIKCLYFEHVCFTYRANEDNDSVN